MARVEDVKPVQDPVCGMVLESSRIEAQSTYAGREFYFCSRECRDIFDQDPHRYLPGATDSTPQAAAERELS
jgi:YHS domain-containing protein